MDNMNIIEKSKNKRFDKKIRLSRTECIYNVFSDEIQKTLELYKENINKLIGRTKSGGSLEGYVEYDKNGKVTNAQKSDIARMVNNLVVVSENIENIAKSYENYKGFRNETLPENKKSESTPLEYYMSTDVEIISNIVGNVNACVDNVIDSMNNINVILEENNKDTGIFENSITQVLEEYGHISKMIEKNTENQKIQNVNVYPNRYDVYAHNLRYAEQLLENKQNEEIEDPKIVESFNKLKEYARDIYLENRKINSGNSLRVVDTKLYVDDVERIKVCLKEADDNYERFSKYTEKKIKNINAAITAEEENNKKEQQAELFKLYDDVSEDHMGRFTYAKGKYISEIEKYNEAVEKFSNNSAEYKTLSGNEINTEMVININSLPNTGNGFLTIEKENEIRELINNLEEQIKNDDKEKKAYNAKLVGAGNKAGYTGRDIKKVEQKIIDNSKLFEAIPKEFIEFKNNKATNIMTDDKINKIFENNAVSHENALDFNKELNKSVKEYNDKIGEVKKAFEVYVEKLKNKERNKMLNIDGARNEISIINYKNGEELFKFLLDKPEEKLQKNSTLAKEAAQYVKMHPEGKRILFDEKEYGLNIRLAEAYDKLSEKIAEMSKIAKFIKSYDENLRSCMTAKGIILNNEKAIAQVELQQLENDKLELRGKMDNLDKLMEYKNEHIKILNQMLKANKAKKYFDENKENVNKKIAELDNKSKVFYKEKNREIEEFTRNINKYYNNSQNVKDLLTAQNKYEVNLKSKNAEIERRKGFVENSKLKLSEERSRCRLKINENAEERNKFYLCLLDKCVEKDLKDMNKSFFGNSDAYDAMINSINNYKSKTGNDKENLANLKKACNDYMNAKRGEIFSSKATRKTDKGKERYNFAQDIVDVIEKIEKLDDIKKVGLDEVADKESSNFKELNGDANVELTEKESQNREVVNINKNVTLHEK